MRKPVALIAAALALAGLASVAPDRSAWPQAARTIRVVLTVPPGGSIDILFRLLAEQISSTRGQTIIIESRPGAGGAIAAEAVARAAPDGATLLRNNNGTIISSILRKVNYDPLASFEPICSLTRRRKSSSSTACRPIARWRTFSVRPRRSRANCRWRASAPTPRSISVSSG